MRPLFVSTLFRRQTNSNTSQTTITVWVFSQILLMVLFGEIKFVQQQFRSIVRELIIRPHGRLIMITALDRLLLLMFVVGQYHRTVLRTDIVALTSPCAGS